MDIVLKCFTDSGCLAHLIGCARTGRADFHGSDPARLFQSVREHLLPLPGRTVVLPGHSCGDVLFTTISHERRHNPAMMSGSGPAYAASLKAVPGAGNTPQVDRILAANLEAEPPSPAEAGPSAEGRAGGGPGTAPESGAGEADLKALAPRAADLAREGRWIDVRDPHEYRAGHIPGSRNVPLSELGLRLDDLLRGGTVVFSCQDGSRSLTAARTLAYLGVIEHPISLKGGLEGWVDSGRPVERP